MTPVEYEKYVASVYAQEGYDTVVTPASGDGGVDVYATKGEEKLAIQCKHYVGSQRSVNLSAILQLYGAAALYDCTRGVMVTDGKVLPDAERAAKKLNVEIRHISQPSHFGINDTPNPTKVFEENPVQVNNSDTTDELKKMLEELIQKSQKDFAHKTKKIPKKTGKREITTKKLPPFVVLWEKYIKTLVGQKVYLGEGTENDDFNIILSVTNAGLRRISRTGNPSKKTVPVEAFRYAYNKLVQDKEVSRDNIEEQKYGFCSSIVVAVLATVPGITRMYEPFGLKVKD